MSRILALLVFGLLSTLPTTWADEPPSLTIEGYTDQLSYRPDDSVELHVSTIARTYNLEITRLGDKNEVVLTKTGSHRHLASGSRECLVAWLPVASLISVYHPSVVAIGLLQRPTPRDR